jgi:hypothetical protein
LSDARKFEVGKRFESVGSKPRVSVSIGGHAVTVSGDDAALDAFVAALTAPVEPPAPVAGPAGKLSYWVTFLVNGQMRREIFWIDPPGLAWSAEIANLEALFSQRYGAPTWCVAVMPIQVSPQIEVAEAPAAPAGPEAKGEDSVPELVQ